MINSDINTSLTQYFCIFLQLFVAKVENKVNKNKQLFQIATQMKEASKTKGGIVYVDT